MGTNRETLIGHFDTGDRPTEQQMHSFINSTINVEEGTSQYISDIFCLASGSQDFFHQIAPPFVPNLQPYIKVVNFDGHTSLSVSGSGGYNELSDGEDDITTMFRLGPNNNNGEYFHPYHSTAIGMKNGGFRMLTVSSPNHYNSLSTTITPFKVQKNTPFWFKTKIQLSNASDVKFFTGFCDSQLNVPSFNPNDIAENAFQRSAIGVRWDGSTLKAAFCSTGGAGNNLYSGCDFTLNTTLQSFVVLNLGIIWNGIDKFYFYTSKGNSAQNPTDPLTLDTTVTVQQIDDNSSGPLSALPTNDDSLKPGSSAFADTSMKLIFHMEGDGDPQSLTFEYLQAAIKTNTF